jgi:hypothetical protein
MKSAHRLLAVASIVGLVSVGVLAFEQFSLVQTFRDDNLADAIRSDGAGPYMDDPRQTGKDPDYLESYSERRYGDLVLDTTGSTRCINLTFGPGNLLSVIDGARRLPESGCFPARLTTKSGGTGDTAVGETKYKGMSVQWIEGGSSYFVGFGSASPGTDRIQVTCNDTGAAGSPCSHWTLSPSGCVENPDGCTPGRARVYIYAGKGKSAGWYPVADYAMAFSLDAVRQ